jgi:hypothetical protein
MGMACSNHGEEEECIYVTGGKARRNETIKKTSRRWVDNIKLDLREVTFGGIGRIDLDQVMIQRRSAG